jgi:hypothetical protein
MEEIRRWDLINLPFEELIPVPVEWHLTELFVADVRLNERP